MQLLLSDGAKTILASYFLPFRYQCLLWLHNVLYLTLEQSHATLENHCSVAVPNPKGRPAAPDCHPCCLGNFWNVSSPVLGAAHFPARCMERICTIPTSGCWKILPNLFKWTQFPDFHHTHSWPWFHLYSQEIKASFNESLQTPPLLPIGAVSFKSVFSGLLIWATQGS